MIRWLFIFIFPFLLHSQTKVLGVKWNLTPDQDLTLDYYSRVLFTGAACEVLNHFTKNPLISGFVGFGSGEITAFFERGLSGKVVSSGGAGGGLFYFIVRVNEKRRKKEETLNRLKSIYE